MPFLECPNCGEIYHASVRDVESWFKERYPNLKSGELPQELCFGCFKDIQVGDKVYFIREKHSPQKYLQDGIGTVIEKIIAEDNLVKFKVRFLENRIEILPREKLYYSLSLNKYEG
jgi:hypothetical protein